ncbi:MAG: AsmA-like C-terminal region-containing protein, partial [Candidatus Omnitrophota bacterium]|nr:AsmA-like C-terminal region-containing protein [Candidatus Omnitrophota bacterium]
MKIKKIIIIILAMVLCVWLFPIKLNTINHVILLPFEKAFQKKIEFTASSIWLPGKIFLKEASVTDKSGKLYYCEEVSFRYNVVGMLFGKKELTFNLKKVNLYRDVDLLNSVSAMLEMSKIPDIEFDAIAGAVKFYKDGIHIKRLSAYNDAMRISGDGRVNAEGVLNCNVNFSFSKNITDMIPDIGKAIILKDEGDGWMGLSLNVTGNYKRPSLRL